MRKESRIIGAQAFVDGKSFNRANIISDGVVIYSYGSHFPMARKLADGTIAVNVDRYSPTTSKHQRGLYSVLLQNGYRPTDTRVDIHDRYAFEVWTR